MRSLKICVMMIVLGFQAIQMTAGEDKDRDYWIDRYFSVSYPLRKIEVTSSYGYRTDPFTGKKAFHGGLDLKADKEEVMAMFDGIVLETGRDGKAGKYIVVQHGRYRVNYCHLSKIEVLDGDTVLAGSVIGVTGNTGRSTGPHLHLTVKKEDRTVDPYSLLLYIRERRKESYLALGGEDKEAAVKPEDFMKTYAPMAMEQQQKYGIPASVTLAQMAVESGWGQSELARKGNNYFGIKATKSWIAGGKPYSLHDDDKPKEAFCNYSSTEESIEHHSQLLMSNRYRKCRKHSDTDYHGWLVALKQAGYATAKNYVQSCEKIIKRHKLYLYDALAKKEAML